MYRAFIIPSGAFPYGGIMCPAGAMLFHDPCGGAMPGAWPNGGGGGMWPDIGMPPLG